MADDQPPPRQRWEYRVEQYFPADAPATSGQGGQEDYRLQAVYRGRGLATFEPLSALGEDGWELVSVSYNMPFEMTYEMVFKRPLVEDEDKHSQKKTDPAEQAELAKARHRLLCSDPRGRARDDALGTLPTY